MRDFKYSLAQSIEEASEHKANGATIFAGGTDLLGVMKDAILEEPPKELVDIKRIPGAAGITQEAGKIKIGAATRLSEIVDSDLIKEELPLLAEAAHSVATPNIRTIGTIGGNICQDVRCWFYRYPHKAGGRLNCMRKGGCECYAIQGDNRYHSIFGGMRPHIPSCTRECPASTDVSSYMAQLRAGNVDAAAEIIMRVNPMPMITSRICPHPCEDACNQNSHGENVGIHCVERSVGDYILEHADKFYPAPAAETGKKIAVIGAGPSGLAFAYYMRKAGHQVTVYDRQEKAGGVLRYGIPHYRLPKDILDRFIAALEGMGVQFKMNTDVGSDVKLEDLDAQNDGLFVGTGAWKQPVLGIHGEELTQFGLNFLVEVNTYLKKVAQFGDNVLVCGGGNVAMDVALTAVRLGAKNVTLACLEQENEMPAQKEEIARAKEEGVTIINGRGLSRILDEGGKVTGLEAVACTSVYDEKGRFNPQYDQNDKIVISSDCIILATGQRVDLDFLGDKYASQIKSERGLLKVDKDTFTTAIPRVYAGGDAVTGPNIAIRAINAGGVAAKSMSRELGYAPAAPEAMHDFLHFDTEGVKARISVKLSELPVAERTLEKEDSASLAMEQAIEEAKRCMNCSCYAVDPSDIAPVLIALGATIVTNERSIPAEEFFCSTLKTADMLHAGELVVSIEIDPPKGAVMHYDKFRLRDAIDFAMVSLASVYRVESGVIKSASLVMGGVAPIPLNAREAAAYLVGKPVSEDVAKEAAEIALKGVAPLEKNEYKVNEIQHCIVESVLRLK